MVLEEKDLIVHKALIEDMKSSLLKIHSKVEKKCMILYGKFDLLGNKYAKTSDVRKISTFEKLYKTTEESMISVFALKNRIQVLIQRCEDRLAFINGKLKESGIYNDKIDKKEMLEIQKKYVDYISIESLNLNQNAKDGSIYKLINGEIYKFMYGKLSFEDEFNQRVLLGLESAEIGKIIELFPYSVSTIPVDFMLNTAIKRKILKEITGYVVEESKTKSIKDINKNLGSLLSFKSEYTENAVDYIAGVQNLYDVQIKQVLMENLPEKSEEINEKLKCNEKSELIPPSKINIAVLANGVAGEIAKDETEESEDYRIDKEKEERSILEAMKFLSELFGESESEEEKQEEIVEQKAESEEEQARIKMNEEQEKEKAEAEAMAELERMLAKTPSDHND